MTVKLKLIFGFVLLGMLFLLACFIALGKVHAESSYGLLPVIATLSTLAGGFSQWAFGNKKEDNEE